MSPALRPLEPFGVALRYPRGTRFDSLDPAALRALLEAHRVVLLRGLEPEDHVGWPASVRRLGPLQVWPFGAVHEVKVDAEAENYLYTRSAVPLHWDGAFKGEVPGVLAFACVEAPSAQAGGATLFVDTTRVLQGLDPEDRARFEQVRLRYATERKAHYGGAFESDLVCRHPLTGEAVLRYAQPVHDLNPVSVEAVAGPEVRAGLDVALARPDVVLRHHWEPGDVLLADNHRLLHGRDAFAGSAGRHLLRVNVLDQEGGWSTLLKDSLRIRRLEFGLAELPIALIAACLAASQVSELLSGAFLATLGALALLYQAGDMANCLADRELDVSAKTGLAEAVRRLGVRNVGLQIGLSVLLALGLAALAGPEVFGLTALGAVLGAGYSLPPLAFKGRGLWQLPYSAGILFVGPMVLVDVAMTGGLHPRLLLASVLFGVMQQGALLVNVAEDITEDRWHGVRTAAVVLGAENSLRLALVMVALAGPALALTLAWPLLDRPGLALLAVLALLGANAWCLQAIARLARRVTAEPERARELIRKQVPELPGWLTFQAWGALVVAAVSLT